jgi:hypothetical protein
LDENEPVVLDNHFKNLLVEAAQSVNRSSFIPLDTAVAPKTTKAREAFAEGYRRANEEELELYDAINEADDFYFAGLCS